MPTEEELSRPPVLGTWPRVYAGVVIYLVVIIAAFAVFAASFRL